MKKIAIAALLFVTTAAFAQSPPAPPQPAPSPRAAMAPAPSPSPVPAAAPSPLATPAAPRAPQSVTQLFQVVVLHGTMGGVEATENVPRNVERAIEDVRDFLPFKRYRFIDSGLIRLTSGTHGQLILDGVNNTTYRVTFSFAPRSSSEVQIEELIVHPVAGSGVDQIIGKPVIQTSFEITKGETVVVGSSRLGGGTDALILLLTAVKSK
ncbi:MAG TPA: hypothetical protein VGF69_00800 [Thermoanaerobaculia bacterium]|jgi:hypothetical protein